MKNLFTLFFLLLSVCLHAQLSDRFSFSQDQLRFETPEGDYTSVSFESCGFTDETGAPQMPCLCQQEISLEKKQLFFKNE